MFINEKPFIVQLFENDMLSHIKNALRFKTDASYDLISHDASCETLYTICDSATAYFKFETALRLAVAKAGCAIVVDTRKDKQILYVVVTDGE